MSLHWDDELIGMVLILSVLECEIGAQLFIVSHRGQVVSVYEKWVVLNKEWLFIKLLRVCNVEKITKFLWNYTLNLHVNSALLRDSIQNSGTVLSDTSMLDYKKPCFNWREMGWYLCLNGGGAGKSLWQLGVSKSLGSHVYKTFKRTPLLN